MDTRRNVRAVARVTACAAIALIATPSLANEQMMRHERGNTMRDVGTGLAIGVVTGIIVNELTKPDKPPRSRGETRRPRPKDGDGGTPRAPKINPLLNLGPPAFTWGGFDIFKNGEVREHVDPPPAPPGGAAPPGPAAPPAGGNPPVAPGPGGGAVAPPPKEKPVKCIVTGAMLKFTGQADDPLQLPPDFTAPAPGAAPSANLGTSNGPLPGGEAFFAGNSFEYHSDLNGVHDCSSNQYKVAWLFNADKTSGEIKEFVLSPDAGKPLNFEIDLAKKKTNSWKVDGQVPGGKDISGRDAYAGNTHTGKKPPNNGAIYYEGTPQKIHWVDSPGWTKKPEDKPLTIFNIALLRSQTLDADGKGGWFCLSGHTLVTDYKTGRPLALADAQTMLKGVSPKGSDRTKATAKAVNAAATGLTANPEFRDLGCYKF